MDADYVDLRFLFRCFGWVCSLRKPSCGEQNVSSPPSTSKSVTRRVFIAVPHYCRASLLPFVEFRPPEFRPPEIWVQPGATGGETGSQARADLVAGVFRRLLLAELRVVGQFCSKCTAADIPRQATRFDFCL